MRRGKGRGGGGVPAASPPPPPPPAKARTAVTLLLYANDPNHDWMPPDLRNLPLSDPRVQKFLGEVAGAHDTSRLDNDYSGMDQTRLNAMILALDAVDGAFSRQQIGQQVR